MSEIRFYHLTRSPLWVTLPVLLEKSLQRGWRVLLHCGASVQMDFLDDMLWKSNPDSFIPHGLEGAKNAADQPVLLGKSGENLNNANVLMLLEGAHCLPDEMAKYEITCVFFNGNDPAALDIARSDWKAVNAAKLRAVYWAQDENGAWMQRAISDPAG